MPWFHCVNWKNILGRHEYQKCAGNLSKNVFCIARSFDFLLCSHYSFCSFIQFHRFIRVLFFCFFFFFVVWLSANMPEMDAITCMRAKWKEKRENLGEYELGILWRGIRHMHISQQCSKTHNNTNAISAVAGAAANVDATDVRPAHKKKETEPSALANNTSKFNLPNGKVVTSERTKEKKNRTTTASNG